MRAQVEFYLNNYTTVGNIATALGKVRYNGHYPDQAAALRLARNVVFGAGNGARLADPSVQKLVVVVTNNPSTNATATLAEAAALRSAGIGVVTIGIGSHLNIYELTAAASYPFAKYSFTVPFSRNFSSVSDSVKRIICSGEYPAPNTRPGSGKNVDPPIVLTYIIHPFVYLV